MSNRDRSRPVRRRFRWVAAVGIVGTVALAAGAFSLSFTSLMHLALRSGVPAAQAWEWPLIVDGMIIVATVGVVARARQPGVGFAWLLLTAGALTSIAGNALQAARLPTEEPTIIAIGVATIPPLVLLACTHMTVILTRPLTDQPVHSALPDSDVLSDGSTGLGSLGSSSGGADVESAEAPTTTDAPAGPVPHLVANPGTGTRSAARRTSTATPGGDSAASGIGPSDLLDGDGGEPSRTWRAEKAQRLRDAGLSVAEIAQGMGVSTGSVRRYLKPTPAIDEPTEGEPS